MAKSIENREYFHSARTVKNRSLKIMQTDVSWERKK
jgi:hypothetical protein